MQAQDSGGYLSGHVYLRPPAGTVWHMRYRLPDGSESRQRIGQNWTGRGRPAAGCFTRRMAEAHLQAFLERYASVGGDPLFAVAAAEYLAYCEDEKGLAKGTTAGYRGLIDHHLVPALGQTRLSRVTVGQLVALRSELEALQLSASTINKVRTVLLGVYKRARRAHGYAGQNVAAEFERVKCKDPGRIDVYTPVEIEALARHAASLQDAAMLRVAAYAGLRRSEIRALRWREVDFTAATIRVRSGYTDEDGERLPKSRRVRSVPLIDQAAGALNDLSRREHFTDPDDLVFGNEVGETLSGDVIARRYVAAARAAGLYRLIDGKRRVLRLHDLRHTFGTLAVQIWPVTDVQAYLGHAQIATTMRYVHFKPHTDAAAKLGALVADAVNAGAAPPWDRLGTVGDLAAGSVAA